MENRLINHIDRLNKLKSRTEVATNFPKNPPPSGIEYSKNFASYQKNGRFSVQTQG
jgi:hypothetical protein